MARPRLEVIPLDGTQESVVKRVPRDLTVTVTSSPSRGLEATLALTGELTGRGYYVVPHLAARQFRGNGHLQEVLARIRELGVREAFVVAGDLQQPLGPFEGAAALLSAMAELGHGLDQVGITGYPESHAFISDEATIQAMFEKIPFATYIVSQIVFDAAVIGGWIRRVRDRGVTLPIYIGLPGPIDAIRLLRLSKRVGVGESARFLRRHGTWLGRLTRPRSYDPQSLIERLAPDLAQTDSGIAGLHIFTFNEVARTEDWRRRELERLRGERGHRT